MSFLILYFEFFKILKFISTAFKSLQVCPDLCSQKFLKIYLWQEHYQKSGLPYYLMFSTTQFYLQLIFPCSHKKLKFLKLSCFTKETLNSESLKILGFPSREGTSISQKRKSRKLKLNPFWLYVLTGKDFFQVYKIINIKRIGLFSLK